MSSAGGPTFFDPRTDVVTEWDHLHRRDVQNAVKLTFADGASLPDPSKVFNAGLEGNTRRAIEFHEEDSINAKALKSSGTAKSGRQDTHSRRGPRVGLGYGADGCRL